MVYIFCFAHIYFISTIVIFFLCFILADISIRFKFANHFFFLSFKPSGCIAIQSANDEHHLEHLDLKGIV